MMALKFWTLDRYDPETEAECTFIVWNEDTGEAQFFEVWGSEDACGIHSFTERQMAIVNKRYHDYLAEQGVTQPTPGGIETIDRKAFDDFMRGL